MEILVGYRDPNFVPIKDFYEYNFNVNYLSLFIKDDKPVVKEEFLEILENWLETLPDREDHFPRLFPYLLTFLFDKDDHLRQQTVESLEFLGKSIEREKYDTFRDDKQFHVQSFWCKKYVNPDLVNLYPFKKRPRLGTRYLIQTVLGKLIPPIIRELKDSINYEYRLNALKLLKYLIFIAEDQIIDHVSSLLPNFIKNIKNDETGNIRAEVKTCCFLIGRYLDFDKIFPSFSVYIDCKSPLFDYSELFIPYISAFLQGNFEDSEMNNNTYQLKNIQKIIDFIDEQNILNQNIDFRELIESINDIILHLSDENIQALMKNSRLIISRMYYYTVVYDIYKNYSNLKFTKEPKYIDINFLMSSISENLSQNDLSEIDIKIIFYFALTRKDLQFICLFLDTITSIKDVKYTTIDIVIYLVKKHLAVDNDKEMPLINHLLLYLKMSLDHLLETKSKHIDQYISFYLEFLALAYKADGISNVEDEVINLINYIKTLHRYFNTRKEYKRQYLTYIDSVLNVQIQLKKQIHNDFNVIFKEFVENSFLIHEVDDDFPYLISIMVKLLHTMYYLLSNDEFETEFLDMYLKFYWQLHIEDNKKRIKDAYVKIFKTDKQLLKHLITKYEQENRLNKVEYYKQFIE